MDHAQDRPRPHDAPPGRNAGEFHRWMDGDPARGPCCVRCFDCLNAEADRDAKGWVAVGVILLGFAAMLAFGVLVGNGTVAGWLR